MDTSTKETEEGTDEELKGVAQFRKSAKIFKFTSIISDNALSSFSVYALITIGRDKSEGGSDAKLKRDGENED